jgi:RHS repeat-associated protein
MRRVLSFLLTSLFLILPFLPAAALGLPVNLPLPTAPAVLPQEIAPLPRPASKNALKSPIPKNQNLTYDLYGNVKLAGDRLIVWNYDNRPIRIITPDGTKTEFQYDFEGTRVRKTVTPASGSAVTTYFIGNVFEKTGSETIAYIHAGSQRIAMVRNGTETRYFHGDHLGSTHLMTNDQATVIRTTKYTPFGGTYETSGTADNAHKFTGQILDGETGLYFYNARFYDPALGRFITPDIIVQAPYDPQTLNRYTYVRNNPIKYTDPSGYSFSLSRTFRSVEKEVNRGWHKSGGADFWMHNRYYVGTAALIAATWGAGSYFAAGSLGQAAFSSALTGEVVGATFGGIAAARHGGDVGRRNVHRRGHRRSPGPGDGRPVPRHRQRGDASLDGDRHEGARRRCNEHGDGWAL